MIPQQTNQKFSITISHKRTLQASELGSQELNLYLKIEDDSI